MTELNLSLNASGFVYDKYMTYSDFDLIKYCGIVENGFFRLLIAFTIFYVLSELIFYFQLFFKKPSLKLTYGFFQKVFYNFMPVLFLYYLYFYFSEHDFLNDNTMYIFKTIFFIIMFIIAVFLYEKVYKYTKISREERT